MEVKPKMPKRNEMSAIIDTEFKRMESNLRNILDKIESKFSFTVDAWSALNKKSYYGITIHFISDDWNLKSTTLDVIESNGKHA